MAGTDRRLYVVADVTNPRPDDGPGFLRLREAMASHRATMAQLEATIDAVRSSRGLGPLHPRPRLIVIDGGACD
jgi:hypothetical protein